MHRVDVESGYGAVTPVDDALAVDGIDEVLDWFLSYQAEDVGTDAPGRGTVAVRTGDRIWRLDAATRRGRRLPRARPGRRRGERRALRALPVAVGAPAGLGGRCSRVTRTCWPGCRARLHVVTQ